MEELLDNEMQVENAIQTNLSPAIHAAELFNQSSIMLDTPLEITK